VVTSAPVFESKGQIYKVTQCLQGHIMYRCNNDVTFG